MGDVWDVANAALFLASDEARYVTGVVLPVDGGLALKWSGWALVDNDVCLKTMARPLKAGRSSVEARRCWFARSR